MAGLWVPCCCGVTGSGGSPFPGSGSGAEFPPPPTFGARGSSGLVSCSCCAGGVAPLQVQVEVANIVAGSGNPPFVDPCANCPDYDGAWILDFTPDLDESLAFCLPVWAACHWTLPFDEVCGRSRAHFGIGCSESGVELQFAIMPDDCDGGGQWLRWYAVVATPPADFSCLFDGLELASMNEFIWDCMTTDPVRVYAV